MFSNKEIDVLASLISHREDDSAQTSREITEIATTAGMDSNEDVQRALFVLEGRSLVTPEPAGDLTSHHWKITDVGVKALEFLRT